VNNSRPKAKLSRALGIPLTPKCVKYFERRPFPPGVHGRGRRKASSSSTPADRSTGYRVCSSQDA
jgi:hypothetical protein